MGSITINSASGGGVISVVEHDVFVGGERNDYLECVSIRIGSGCGGTMASFRCPAFVFDALRGNLRDRAVSVWVDGVVKFTGYLSGDSATLAEGGDGFTLDARSITSWLRSVHVGQPTDADPDGQYEVEFKFRDEFEQPTGETPARVLDTLFLALPAELSSRLALGQTDVLRGAVSAATPTLAFRGATYEQAIDQVCALYGDVAYAENFTTDGKTLLDFYRVGQVRAFSGAPIVVAQGGDIVAEGANVAELNRGYSSAEAVARVVFHGDRRVFAVSCASITSAETQPVDVETDERRTLRRLWNPDYEAAVLADPKTAAAGSLGYAFSAVAAVTDVAVTLAVDISIDLPVGALLMVESTGEKMLVTGFVRVGPDPGPASATATVTRGWLDTPAAAIAKDAPIRWLLPGVEHVFKRYGLPLCLLPFKRAKNLPMQSLAKEPLANQAWIYETHAVPSADAGVDWQGAFGPPEAPTKVTATFDLDKGTVTFREPCVQPVLQRTVATSKIGFARTYVETVAGVTIAFLSDQPVGYDTGRDAETGGVALPFATSGCVQREQRDDLKFEQATNHGWPVPDPDDGAGIEFFCIWFTDAVVETEEGTTQVGDTVTIAAADEPVVIRDDTATLRALARDTLRERSRPHVAWMVRIPYFSGGYRIGDAVTLQGIGGDLVAGGPWIVTAVGWSLARTELATELTVENIRPPRRVVASLPGQSAAPSRQRTGPPALKSTPSGLAPITAAPREPFVIAASDANPENMKSYDWKSPLFRPPNDRGEPTAKREATRSTPANTPAGKVNVPRQGLTIDPSDRTSTPQFGPFETPRERASRGAAPQPRPAAPNSSGNAADDFGDALASDPAWSDKPMMNGPYGPLGSGWMP